MAKQSIISRPFGTTRDGQAVWEITLTNGAGASVSLLSYGCTIRAIRVPDRAGTLRDVALGYATLAEYERCGGYLGATVGRCANRIAGGRFTLGGTDYQIYQNDGPNSLHGGLRGFDKYVWDYAVKGQSAVFSRLSPDGEENFPGNLRVQVTVRFDDDGTLSLVYEAETDRDTIVNLTNHVYLNLEGAGDVLSHELWLRASACTPADSALIPTGALLPVAGTPFDFTRARPIGAGPGGQGYDINFAIDKAGAGGPVARVFAPRSGITLEAETDLPGVQLYTGAGLSGEQRSKEGAPYAPFGGMCLETQFFPDAVNQPAFQSPILRAGEGYSRYTRYRFGVR